MTIEIEIQWKTDDKNLFLNKLNRNIYIQN